MRNSGVEIARGPVWLPGMACVALVWMTELWAAEPLVPLAPGSVLASNTTARTTNPAGVRERPRRVPRPSFPTPELGPYLKSAREGDVFAINMVTEIYGQQGNWLEFSRWGQRRNDANAVFGGDLSGAFTHQFRQELALAKAGDPFHQLVVGVLYARGVGTKRQPRQAAEWYWRSAEARNPMAQTYLGRLYELGRGVPQDTQEAMTWYEEGAAVGNPLARHNLAMNVLRCSCTVETSDYGIGLLTAAAEQGFLESQCALGRIYSDEPSRAGNRALARFWFGRAAESGSEDAKKGLQLLDSRHQAQPSPGSR